MVTGKVLTLTVVIFIFSVSNIVADGIPGGRTKIRDVKKDKEVQELGRYSVEEHNRLQKGSVGDLRFSKVVEGETQVVSGIKYYLKIEAFSKSKPRVAKLFDAVVVVKPWLHTKQLLDFKPSKGKE